MRGDVDIIVSIVIPTFNRKALTDSSVQSVVSVSPTQLEIVVVDDSGDIPYFFGSEFNSSGISVRVIRLPVNVGAGMARQAGVAHASGRYVAFLDSDDCYDAGWIDYVLALLRRNSDILNQRIYITGITQGERKIGALTRKILSLLPQCFQLTASRLIAIFFNPFYMQSTVMSRDLCIFKNGLRYCEDYYTTAFALFFARKLYLPEVTACHLGRLPNSFGGLSFASEKMYRGEMLVRLSMLQESCVPFGYKLLVPLGMVYQWCRTGVKKTFHF